MRHEVPQVLHVWQVHVDQAGSRVLGPCVHEERMPEAQGGRSGYGCQW